MNQEKMEDTDGAKVTAKKEEKKSSNANENNVDKKRVGKNMHCCNKYITSVFLRHLENLTYGKDCGTDKSGILVTQERMTDTDAAKVDAYAKADAPDASNTSNFDIPKIYVKIGIGKPRAIVITLR